MSNTVAVALNCTAMQCGFSELKNMPSLCPYAGCNWGARAAMSHAAAAALSCTATLYVSSGPCTSTITGAAARAHGQQRRLPSGCGSACGPAPVRAQSQQLVKSVHKPISASYACLQLRNGAGTNVCRFRSDGVHAGRSGPLPAAVRWARRRR